jgi:hypothetical protein
MWERKLRQQNGVDARKFGARWVYVDLWDQALQRPDAHSDPAVDCLHCKLSLFLKHFDLLVSDVRFLQGVCLPYSINGRNIFIISSFLKVYRLRTEMVVDLISCYLRSLLLVF